MDEPSGPSQSKSSDYFGEEDSQFLEALHTTVLPGDVSRSQEQEQEQGQEEEDLNLEPPPLSQFSLKRHRYLVDEDKAGSLTTERGIPAHENDDTYGASRFGEFGEYMRRKRAKLQIQNSAMEDPGQSSSQIFKGLSIYINGWTRPSVQDLRQLIVKHGGIFQAYLDRKGLVTHIITCSLTPAKIREFKHMKVVRPEWLVESAEAGVLLPWKNYIYVHGERLEDSQGARNKQKSLLEGKSSIKAPDITPPKDSRQASDLNLNVGQQPKSRVRALSAKPPMVPDVLFTTDPVNAADAARVPGYASSTSNVFAQRAMADPNWRKVHTSVAPDFIEGYYKNSRLHHLSMWKSELKDLVQEAQERAEAGIASQHTADPVGKIDSELKEVQGSGLSGVSMRGAGLTSLSSLSKWKGKGRAVDDQDRVIMHCDFDCFFVSAGLVSRPEMKGKPVVVCHSQGAQGGASSTSEIASSSYEARAFGIRNGMSLQQARKLCPGVITIPYEFERYKEFSLQFYTVLMSHADDLQAVSVDEALLDVSSTVAQLRKGTALGGPQDPAKNFAEMIRTEVRNATGCEVSIGISHNMLLARLATRHAKPAGSFHLTPDEVPTFLAPLDISDLHGFGWSTKQKAQEKLGVTTLGDLLTKSKAVLSEVFGKSTGETLYNAVRGIDDKKLESDKPRKSVSCEINYGIRFENNEQAEAFIHQMATEVKQRLDAIDMIGRSITLKIMKRDPSAPLEPPKFLGHGLCDLFSKQSPLIGPGGQGSSSDQAIAEHAMRLLKSFNFDPTELRGVGIQIQKLESASAPSAPPGQAVLPFKRLETSTKPGPSVFTIIEPPKLDIIVQPPTQDEDVVMEKDKTESASEAMKPSALDLPSFSQVDMSVFDALPEDLRQELEIEYKRRSVSPFVTEAPIPRLGERGSMPSPIFPGNVSTKGPNYKRLSKQLAPRSRATISPQKSALFKFLKQQPAKASVKISEKDLRQLGLDPEVFAILPVKVQREQLVMARLIKEKGSLPEVPTERKILKPVKPLRTPSHRLWRAPPPKARYRQPPFLRQQGKEKKDKLYFTETDDIQQVVEKWVSGYQHWVPKEKDIEFLSKYLLQSVDSSKGGDVGVERAIAILKWWLVLLRRFWPACELIEEGEPDGSQTDRVGEAWWKAFRDVKEQLDVVARRKFGGRLSLR